MYRRIPRYDERAQELRRADYRIRPIHLVGNHLYDSTTRHPCPTCGHRELIPQVWNHHAHTIVLAHCINCAADYEVLP